MAERYLLVQLGDIGDMVLTTPAISALREAQPDAHIGLLTTKAAATLINPELANSIHTVPRGMNRTLALLSPTALGRIWRLRRGQYTTAIFFHHFTIPLGTLKFALIARASGAQRIIGLDNGNGWFLTERLLDEGFGAKHQAQYWLDLVALCGASAHPRRPDVAFHSGVLPLSVHRGIRIVMHAGGGEAQAARRWAPERFAQVADALVAEYDAQVVLVGTASDDTAQVLAAMQQPAIDLTGQTSLTQLSDLIRSADLYIGADSGVTHLAAAVRTPMIAIYGPTNDAAWGPWLPGAATVILNSRPRCAPCSYVGHELGALQGCAARTCLRMITSEQVLQAARRLLQTDDIPSNMTYYSNPQVAAVRTARPPTDVPNWSDRIRILGMPVDRITYAQWMELIDRWVRIGSRPRHVCTINPEFMMIARRDPIFRYILQRADLCIPDGVGLLWAARRLKTPLPERVTGSDGTLIIAEHAAKNNWRLFLLGAAPGVAEYTASILRQKFLGIQIVGTYAGSPDVSEEDAIVEMVNASRAHIVLVAYGAPQQDQWIARNLPRLQVKMAMGVGGAFDFIAGVVPRAPEWMRKRGLEWLFRLYRQPWRWRRMLRLPRFVFLVWARRDR